MSQNFSFNSDFQSTDLASVHPWDLNQIQFCTSISLTLYDSILVKKIKIDVKFTVVISSSLSMDSHQTDCESVTAYMKPTSSSWVRQSDFSMSLPWCLFQPTPGRTVSVAPFSSLGYLKVWDPETSLMSQTPESETTLRLATAFPVYCDQCSTVGITTTRDSSTYD